VSDTLQADADRLEAKVREELPPSSTWTMPPRGYRQALALCVVDGVSRQVVGAMADELVASFRSEVGEAAETAGVDTLASRLAVGDPVAPWISSVVHAAQDAARVQELLTEAAQLLTDAGVTHTADLVAMIREQSLAGALGQSWTGREGLTRRMWTDTAMLAGYLDPEVDRMIAAYTSRAMGTDPATTPPERVIAALMEVAKRFDVHILPLEFAILELERPD
jgi:hypothetical protein